MDIHKDLIALLQSIYYHYPIGLKEEDKEWYVGFHELQDIVKNKFNIYINDINWAGNILNERIKNEIGSFESNSNTEQFPNHNLTLYLSHNHNKDYIKELTLEIIISLASDFYTIFFRESYQFFGNDDETTNNSSIYASNSILSFESFYALNTYKEVVDTVMQEILNVFPDKKYISIYDLKSTKIESHVRPFGRSEYNPSLTHTLFDYLFSNFFSDDNYITINK